MEDFLLAGAKIYSLNNDESREGLQRFYGDATLVVSVKRADRAREIAENSILPANVIILGFLDPLDQTTPHVKEWENRNVTAITLDQLPLQPEDERNVLVAMSRIAGQIAVKDAHEKHPKARNALVIGTGSAGSAAIQECFDQGFNTYIAGTGRSLNVNYQKQCVKYIYIPPTLDESEQQVLLLDTLSQMDIVITTARKTGMKAPLLISAASLHKMRAGAVVVDLALTEGGNVEGSANDETKILGNQVIVTNQTGYPKLDPYNASIAFSRCLTKIIQSMAQFNFEGPKFKDAY